VEKIYPKVVAGENESMKFASLFAGIGGFDLGFERAGMECVLQVEKDNFCRELLFDKWPNVPKVEDVKDLMSKSVAADVICGGDPCPSRSGSRFGKKSAHPDLAGYFLAVAGRLRPRWVVRENVVAPDVQDFACGLETLGYAIVIIQINSKDLTAQNRPRQFCIGCPSKESAVSIEQLILESDRNFRDMESSKEIQENFYCLSTRLSRYRQDDNLIYEDGIGIRTLHPIECERLQGFPDRWTEGFSKTASARMTGNAVTVDVAERIGRWIMEVEYGKM